MDESENEYGWISLSELVSDGYRTWFETQRYLYYSPAEAKAQFEQHIKDNKWEIIGPPMN